MHIAVLQLLSWDSLGEFICGFIRFMLMSCECVCVLGGGWGGCIHTNAFMSVCVLAYVLAHVHAMNVHVYACVPKYDPVTSDVCPCNHVLHRQAHET